MTPSRFRRWQTRFPSSPIFHHFHKARPFLQTFSQHGVQRDTPLTAPKALRELAEIILAAYQASRESQKKPNNIDFFDGPDQVVLLQPNPLDSGWYEMIHSVQMSEKELTPKAREALRHIRNFLVHAGKVPSVRELMKAMEYKSPHSPMLLINELERKGFLKKKSSGAVRMIKDLDAKQSSRTVEVPLVGTVACGIPLLAEENIEAFYPVSVVLAKPGSKHFLLRAKGDSMDRAGINDGDLLLVRQQSTADNGEKVVALIDDEATVKEFQWSNGVVVLKPHSSNPKHRPMILTEDVQVLGVVVTALPGVD